MAEKDDGRLEVEPRVNEPHCSKKQPRNRNSVCSPFPRNAMVASDNRIKVPEQNSVEESISHQQQEGDIRGR